uniref:FLYWCH-type domain-containing protein n=1 Tax=Lutzomyia longipalpis TaxID=7200 RepID=A0A1B0GHA5_LUTLO
MCYMKVSLSIIGDRALFGLSQRGSRTLIYNSFKYVKDKQFLDSINWRCSRFRRDGCKARAITRLM